MKTHILFEFVDTSGGGNQFLKLLRNAFMERGLYSDNIRGADVIIVNSHSNFDNVMNALNTYRDKKFVHRLDGIYSLYNNKNDIRQSIALEVNKFVDFSIFQSEWAKNEYFKLDISQKNHCVIPNACANIISKIVPKVIDKTGIILVSMSDNINKGFNYYKYIDEHIDFGRYIVSFIGSSPIRFKNIVNFGKIRNDDIYDALMCHDIFLFASKHECCSNALIEALTCGLPAVYLDSGGNKEIVKSGGEPFLDEIGMINGIEMVANNLDEYRRKISITSIDDITDRYVNVLDQVLK